MANIEKRNSSDGATNYRVKIRLKGFPVQSATFDRITDARKWAQQTEAAIREGRHFKTTEGEAPHISGIDRPLYPQCFAAQTKKYIRPNAAT